MPCHALALIEAHRVSIHANGVEIVERVGLVDAVDIRDSGPPADEGLPYRIRLPALCAALLPPLMIWIWATAMLHPGQVHAQSPSFSMDPPSGAYVFPGRAAPGTERRIRIHGCFDPQFTVQDAGGANGDVTVTFNDSAVGATCTPRMISITPSVVGTKKLKVVVAGMGLRHESAIETLPAVPPRVALDGMWSDPASDGSGIAFHSSARTSAVFGTWFLWGQQPADPSAGNPSRWFSLQQIQWFGDGSTAEGLVYEGMRGASACPAERDCPASLTNLTIAGVLKLTVTGADQVLAEMTDGKGNVLFLSRLRRVL